MSKTTEIIEHLARIDEHLERVDAVIAAIGHNGGPPLDEPPPPTHEDKPVLIADRRVAERYDVSVRTLARWDALPELNFPPPIYIRDRRYRELAKLEGWDRANARKATAQTKPRGVAGRFTNAADDITEAR